MGKTKLLGLALTATMASFTACTNDAEEVLAQEREIKLTSEITPSRVASLDYQTTQIVTGQQVGVTITGIKEGQEHNNIPWSVGDNGALTNTGDAVYYGDGAATITAYHPFNYDWDESTTYPFSVSTDQTDAANYLNSDLLWATATSSKTETAVPLTFSHMLAKINVTLVPENEDDDLNGATISIYNTKTSTTFNPTTGAISTATGEPQEIIAGVTADDVYTASAIVIPQEVSGKFIKITHEGKTYYYTLASGKTLESGYSYSYTLTVKGKQLISTGSSIDEWDDESGNTGDAEEETTSSYANGIAYVANAGELSTIIPAEEKNNITSLKISGYLNSNDIAFIREMGGIDKRFNSTEGKLKSLDISNVNFVEGGEPYLTGSSITPNPYCTRENTISSSMFVSLGLEYIKIPTNITSIEQEAFAGTKISTFEMPLNVNSIGNNAFQSCSLLREIVIPIGIDLIDAGTFANCTSLSTVTIPSSVTNIEYAAFSGCTSLTKIYCRAVTPPTISSSGAFDFSDYSSCALYVPKGKKQDYQVANGWLKFTNIIEEE